MLRMCDRARLRNAGQLLLTAASLGAALGVLHRLGGHTRLRVDWGHLELWLQVTPAGDAAAAVLRLVGLGVTYWLLVSTALDLLACLSGLPGAVRAVRWMTLPAFRSLAERAVALTVVGSTALAGSAVVAGGWSGAGVARAAVAQVEDRPGAWSSGEAFGPAAGVPLPQAPTPVTGPPEPRPDEQTAPDGSHVAPVPEQSGEGIADEPGVRAALPEAADKPADTAERPDAVEQPADTAERPADDGDEPAGAAEEPAQPDGASPSALTPDETYTIAPGDHLWGIARATLAQTWGRAPSVPEIVCYWVDLIALNAAHLRSGDPDLIYPGEVVRLPAVEPAEE